MTHGLFYGSYPLKLDEKHRFLMPSEIRRSINIERDGESFFVIIGINKKIWLYSEKHYIALADQPSDMLPGEDELAFNHLWYGMTDRAILDTQGRLLLPDEKLKKTGIEKEITLVGAKDHIEIWTRVDWSAREAELENQRDQIAHRIKEAKQARTTPPGE